MILAEMSSTFPEGKEPFFFFFFTIVTGPRRFLRLKLSDIRVYEPQIRARLGTPAHFCKVVVIKLSPPQRSSVD